MIPGWSTGLTGQTGLTSCSTSMRFLFYPKYIPNFFSEPGGLYDPWLVSRGLI